MQPLAKSSYVTGKSIPILNDVIEMRRVIYTTNVIELLNRLL
ncbi:MAG: hypothetical protein AAF773_07170 [Cyanobacteria bacterium P01_D01_bin.115]